MILTIVAVLLAATVFGWLWFGDKPAPGEPASKLEEQQQRLEIALDDLRRQGIKVDQPLIWNYMFVNRQYAALAKFIEHMKAQGYSVAEVNEARDEDSGLIDYELRLQKLERHSPETLSVRLREMRDLAARWNLDLFDGWYPEGYGEREEVSH